MKKILITGARGFIGGNLKEYLKHDYEILCPTSLELNLIDKSAVKKYFNSHSVDSIIHCSSIGGVRDVNDCSTTIEDNFNMLHNLLSYKKDCTPIILFGSGAMYNKSRELDKVHEDSLSLSTPQDLYGQAKMKIAQNIQNRDDCVCLNIFACYGYREKENRFPSYAILQNLRKNDIFINQNAVFDYLFVEDMQKIVKYFLEHKVKNSQENIINITPSMSISLLEIAEIVNSLSKYKSKIVIKNPLMNNKYTGSNKRLLENYKDLVFTPYEIGLEKLYNYLKQYQI